MEALAKLGINGWMMFAQALNFALLLFVLYKFAYTPLLGFLDDRSAKIQKGLDDAQEAKKMMQEASAKQAELLAVAQREAKTLLEQADVQAKKRAESTLQLAESQSAKILEDARLQSVQDAKKLLSDAKKDLSELVLSAVEKVVRQKLDASADAELIKKVLS